MKELNCKCDSCGETFIINEELIKLVKVPQTDIEITYFVCPYCNKKYRVASTNSISRQLTDKRKKILADIKVKARTTRNIDFLLWQYKRALNKIKNKQKNIDTKLAKISEKYLEEMSE